MKVRYICNFQPKLFEEIFFDSATDVPRKGEFVKINDVRLCVQYVEWMIEGDTTKNACGVRTFHAVDQTALVYVGHVGYS